MKVYIETLGCSKNVVDSEGVIKILEENEYEIVLDPEEAEVIIVNTCGFIHDAKTESIDTIFEMARYKENNCKMLLVSGCLSQRYGKELFDEIEEIDAMIGVNDYENIVNIIEKAKNEARYLLITKEEEESFLYMTENRLNNPHYTGYLKIAEGCNNRCSYCIIPSIRGNYRSRDFEDIVNEATIMVNHGCKEITLIAQDTTNYGIDKYGRHRFYELIKELSAIKDLKWLRLMYCYPHLITGEMIEAMASSDKVCRYIDIPLQHCSNTILKAMNRKITKADIVEVIKKLREAIPDIHIRTTLIVGFPGETQEDFDELYEFVKETKFDRLGVFAYSKEENTPAAKMDNQVPKKIKQERLETIMELQKEISQELNEAKLGNVYQVLIEEKVEDENVYIGRTEYDAIDIDNSVIFTSDRFLDVGEMVKVRIVDALEYDLIGEIEDEPSK